MLDNFLYVRIKSRLIQIKKDKFNLGKQSAIVSGNGLHEKKDDIFRISIWSDFKFRFDFHLKGKLTIFFLSFSLAKQPFRYKKRYLTPIINKTFRGSIES